MALIVVPNETLLHNHQVELAKALADQNYLIHGHTKYVILFPTFNLDSFNLCGRTLTEDVKNSAEFIKRRAQMPPITSGQHRVLGGPGNIIDQAVWAEG